MKIKVHFLSPQLLVKKKKKYSLDIISINGFLDILTEFSMPMQAYIQPHRHKQIPAYHTCM